MTDNNHDYSSSLSGLCGELLLLVSCMQAQIYMIITLISLRTCTNLTDVMIIIIVYFYWQLDKHSDGKRFP